MLDENELMDVPQTARLLRSNPNTLSQHRFRGTGPRFIKRGRKIYYLRSSVEQWLLEGERTQTEGGESRSQTATVHETKPAAPAEPRRTRRSAGGARAAS